MNRVLAVRLDSDGDVLITGPAIRALASRPMRWTCWCPRPAARPASCCRALREVLTFDAPWIGLSAAAGRRRRRRVADRSLRGRRYARAVIFTSFHQSPLPMALLARLAGIRVRRREQRRLSRLAAGPAASTVRPVHEVEAALDLAVAAGGRLPPGDDGRPSHPRRRPALMTHVPVGPLCRRAPGRLRAVARPDARARRVDRRGTDRGRLAVVVTGGPAERELARGGRRRHRYRPGRADRPAGAGRGDRRRRLHRGGQHRARASRGGRWHACCLVVLAGGARGALATLPGADRAAGKPARGLSGHQGPGLPDRGSSLPQRGFGRPGGAGCRFLARGRLSRRCLR